MTGGGRLSRGFALAIRELEQRGWSRDHLAAELGVRPPTLSRWTTGERSVPIDVLPVVDRLCGEPRGYVLGLSGLVEDKISLKSRIASASELDSEQREILISMYEIFRRDSQADPISQKDNDETEPTEAPGEPGPADRANELADHALESARPKHGTTSKTAGKAS